MNASIVVITALKKLTFVLFQKACASLPFENTLTKFENENKLEGPCATVNAFLKRIKPG